MCVYESQYLELVILVGTFRVCMEKKNGYQRLYNLCESFENLREFGEENSIWLVTMKMREQSKHGE